MVDTIAENGIKHISEVPYKGTFSISFYSKSDLELMQKFFGVRSNKFDMKLLEKRPLLLEKLKREYNENIDSGDCEYII